MHPVVGKGHRLPPPGGWAAFRLAGVTDLTPGVIAGVAVLFLGERVQPAQAAGRLAAGAVSGQGKVGPPAGGSLWHPGRRGCPPGTGCAPAPHGGGGWCAVGWAGRGISAGLAVATEAMASGGSWPGDAQNEAWDWNGKLGRHQSPRLGRWACGRGLHRAGLALQCNRKTM